MTLWEKKDSYSVRLDRLYDELDQSLRTVMQLAESPDPAGGNIHRARMLLREIDAKLTEIQEKDHRLQWTQTLLDLIEKSSGQCTGSDRLQ